MKNIDYLGLWLNQDHNNFSKNIDNVYHKKPKAGVGQ